ncbi:hypothetical protein Tco_0049029 [Tanacetum coccineum]
MGDTIAQTRFENVSKHSNDSLLARGNTLRSDEDRLKLDELIALCTTLQNRVLDLEKTKTTQQDEIASLKRRVKKLEKNSNIDVDYQLAERLQAQEQEELSDVENATLFQQLLEKRRSYFAAKRAEEQRNKPPTQA